MLFTIVEKRGLILNFLLVDGHKELSLIVNGLYPLDVTLYRSERLVLSTLISLLLLDYTIGEADGFQFDLDGAAEER